MAMIVKSINVFLCFVSLCALSGAKDAVQNGGHPMEKVIGTLKELKAKTILDGQDETVIYEKFTHWCSNSIDSLQDAIADEKEQIEELNDLLSGKTKEKETLKDELLSLEEQLGEMDTAETEAQKLRARQEKMYNDKMDGLKKTITAVDAALKEMSTAGKETEASLVQKHMNGIISLIGLNVLVTDVQMRRLQSFADPADLARKRGKERRDMKGERRDQRKEKRDSRPDQLSAGDLDKHVDVYDFKSENVIELLKELKAKFEDDKLATIKGETDAVNSHELAKLARDNKIKAAKASKLKKTDILGGVNSTIEDTGKSLTNEKDDLKVDSKNLKDTKENCATKKREFEQSSKVRKGEIEAVDAAVQILAKATGVRTKPPENPSLPTSPVDFIQVESLGSPKMSAVTLLRQVAQKTHSRALEQLAVEIKNHLSGPFDQMNNMIEKMIYHLMDEQKQEDEHKNWCDHEIEESNKMIENLDGKLDRFSKLIEVEKAKVVKLEEDIEAGNAKIAEIIEFMDEATALREQGKKENKLAIKDAKSAQKALENAIAVLTSFYKESGDIKKEDWEFMQEQSKNPANLPDSPKTWSATYTGSGTESGIISVLEGAMSEFSKMEAETGSQEAVDQEKYEQVIFDNKEEKARRTTELEMKTAEKGRRVEKQASTEREHKSSDAEHEKTSDYLEKLSSACKDGDSSYKDRKEARSLEIAALKKAKGILLAEAVNEAEETKKKASVFLKSRSNA